jgi:hypothetical protein
MVKLFDASVTVRGQATGSEAFFNNISSSEVGAYQSSTRNILDVFDAPQKLPKWRAAIAGMKNGTKNARVLFVGDSTDFGVGSNGTSVGEMVANSCPMQFANQLLAKGINAHSNTFMGGGFGVQAAGGGYYGGANDGRIVKGSSWVVSSGGVISVGGGLYNATSGANALSFTPKQPVDTFTIYYVANSGLGTFNADINGGTATPVNTNATPQNLRSITITGTLGINTLNMKYASGGGVYIAGAEAYDSSKKWVSVINAGWPGAQSNNWDDTGGAPFGVIPGLGVVAPDLTIINLGKNDCYKGTNTVSQFTTHMQAIITACLASGDVILRTFYPNDVAYGSVATQQTYVDAIYALAKTNNLPVIDTYGRWVSYAVSNPLGFYYDQLHPNGAGYSDGSQSILNFLNISSSGVVLQDQVIGSNAGSASPLVLTQAMSGGVFTNTGASAEAYFTLPASPSIGTKYTFYVDAAVGIRAVANTGQTIRVAAGVSTSAGYAESLTVGNSVTIEYIKANTWVSIATNGSWTLA